MAVRITCINKAGGAHENPYVAISSLGWTNDSSGESGNSTRIQMYDFVTQGGLAYVRDGNGNTANLIGEVSASGTKFVKTKADNVTSDNLLKLPECK